MNLDPRVAVLVVNDQMIFRQAAASLVRSIGELRLVGEAAGSEQAVSVARDIRPDFVLMDGGCREWLAGWQASLLYLS